MGRVLKLVLLCQPLPSMLFSLVQLPKVLEGSVWGWVISETHFLGGQGYVPVFLVGTFPGLGAGPPSDFVAESGQPDVRRGDGCGGRAKLP